MTEVVDFQGFTKGLLRSAQSKLFESALQGRQRPSLCELFLMEMLKFLWLRDFLLQCFIVDLTSAGANLSAELTNKRASLVRYRNK